MSIDSEITKYIPDFKGDLKSLEYRGGIANLEGTIVYKVYQKEGVTRIIFSGITDQVTGPSTVNWASHIIIAISEEQGIDWQHPNFPKTHEFYDLSTPIGYTNRLDPYDGSEK